MTQKDIIDWMKRFIITFLICSPIVFLLTLKTNLSSALVILFSVLIIGAIFGLEEFLRNLALKKKRERRQKRERDEDE